MRTPLKSRHIVSLGGVAYWKFRSGIKLIPCDRFRGHFSHLAINIVSEYTPFPDPNKGTVTPQHQTPVYNRKQKLLKKRLHLKTQFVWKSIFVFHALAVFLYG